MTGNDAIEEGRVLLGESLSTGAQQQSQLWPRHVRRAADDLARRNFCLYKTAVCDLVSGQGEYTMPRRPFRQEDFYANDGNGNIFPLDVNLPGPTNELFYNWQSVNAEETYQGIPIFIVAEGLMTLKLLPIPNYSVQDGLIVAGYYGVDEWWDMSQKSPLPEGYDEALVKGAVYRRCQEMQRVDPTYGPLVAQYENDYEKLRRRLYRESGAANAGRRSAIPSKGKRMGAYGYGGWFWWG